MLPTWNKSLSASGCFFIFGFQQLVPGASGGFPCDSPVQGLLCFLDLQIAVSDNFGYFLPILLQIYFLSILGQRRKGKIYLFECRVPKNSKER